MIRILSENRAQANMMELVTLFLMVVLMMIGMTAYFKRAVQDRIFNAREYMVFEVKRRTGPHYNVNFYFEYEPYYLNTVANVTRDYGMTEIHGLNGTSNVVFNEATTARSSSNTAIPARGLDNRPQVHRTKYLR